MVGSRFFRAIGFLLLALTGCGRGRSTPVATDTTTPVRDTSRVLVIREASVVAFWLPASDTLAQGEGADLLDDFRAYTQLVGPFLADRGIPLLSTNAESLFVELADGPRRLIVLAGLDFPFGYVLAEPGFAESILTGVSTEEELLSEVDWYFGLDEEGEDPERHGRVVVLGRTGAFCAAPLRPGVPALREKTVSAETPRPGPRARGRCGRRRSA